VKLGKNAIDTCVILSKAYGGEAVKKLIALEWQKRSKVSSHVEITNESNAHHFLWYQGIVHFELISQGHTVNWPYYVQTLKRLPEALHIEISLNFGPTIVFFTMTVRQLTALCQAVSGPKIGYRNGTPTQFPWFGSEWLPAVSKNKVCL